VSNFARIGYHLPGALTGYAALRQTGVSEATRNRDILGHNWRQLGSMEVHTLVRKSGGVGCGAMWVDGCGTSLLYCIAASEPVASTVKAAFNRSVVPANFRVPVDPTRLVGT
jgi:hypothetical protein